MGPNAGDRSQRPAGLACERGYAKGVGAIVGDAHKRKGRHLADNLRYGERLPRDCRADLRQENQKTLRREIEIAPERAKEVEYR